MPGVTEGNGTSADRDLVVAFQNGDESAYEEVYRRYAGRVRRICVRMLGNTQDADEAVQETFLKAYQALGRFNGSYQLGAWLARIAANVCVDHVRFRARSARLVSLDADHETLGTERGPEDLLAGSDPRIETAIDKIQPLHARALKLRAIGGLSHEEMAGQLSMTPAQVKALLHRARTSFKRAWDRAEALALVPLLRLRSLVGERPQDAPASSNLLGSSAHLSPLLTERVAASAVIVVVALSGAPSVPGGAPATPESFSDRRPIVSEEPVRPARHDAVAGAVFAAGGSAGPSAGGRGPALPGLLIENEDALDTPKPSRDDDDDDDGQGGISPAETAPLLKKARRIVERVPHTVRLPSR